MYVYGNATDVHFIVTAARGIAMVFHGNSLDGHGKL